MQNKKIYHLFRWIFKITVLFAVVLILFLGGKFAFEKGYEMMTADTSSSEEAVIVEVEIPIGASTSKIAEILKENDLISSTLLFRFKAKSSGNDGKFQFGIFKLSTDMNEEQIMTVLLTEGQKKDTIKFTIPEGYTIRQISEKLENEGIVNKDEFLKAVEEYEVNYKFLKDVPDRKYRLQGYLFPNTYEIYKDATNEEIIKILLDEFNKVFKEEYYERAKELNLTVDQVITLASIIEEEVKVEDERKKVSGVIYNRLKVDMKLEMCSSVIYAHEFENNTEINRAHILYKDLEIDSPYNTYLYSGLPIGPISNPGEASIHAALYPEEHDYLFFVLIDEETGEHEFNKTLDAHNAAKGRYNQNY